MNWKAILLLGIAVQQISSIFALKCVITEPPIKRIFKSFEEYQANKAAFTPLRTGFKGSHVEFRFNTIDHLIKNIFNTYDSEHIINLNLSRMAIERIDGGAFLWLSCLHVLDLSFNDIANITEDVFEGLGRVRELNLSHNYLTNISANQFDKLGDLESLDLSSNLITHIDNQAFSNLSSLEKLSMNFNFLKSIPSSLQYLSKLKILLLQSNTIELPQLKSLSSVSETIATLDLSHNHIGKINYTTNTTFPSMKYLNLSHNSLRRLDVYALSTKFPNLRKIDINYNFWECNILFALKQGLYDANITFTGHNNTNSSIICKVGKVPYNKVPRVISSVPQSNNSEAALLEKIFDTVNTNRKTTQEILGKVHNVTSAIVIFIIIVLFYILIKIVYGSSLSEAWYTWTRNRNGYYQAYEEYIDHRPLLQERRKCRNYNILL